MLMQKASCLNTEVSASLSPIPSWMNKVKSIFWQCDDEEDTVVTVTHMYAINEKHKTNNVHYTDPNDYCQASKLTLQITPLLSLNSPYPISSSASLVSFGFTLLA